jgi:hypothetical protein
MAHDRIIWRRDLRKALGDVTDETLRRWIKAGKIPKPDVDLSHRTRGWRLSTLQKSGINLAAASLPTPEA